LGNLNPNGSLVTDNSFYYNTTQYTRGGRTSKYSRRDYFSDCSSVFSSFPVSVNYYFPKILFSTDGACVSTCNSVITHLKDTNNIITLSYGGLLGLDLDIASFAGGNVVDWADFVSAIADNNYASLMTCSASIRFTHHEVYAEGATLPKEYVRQPSDYHAYMWEPVYDNTVYLPKIVSVAQAILSNTPNSTYYSSSLGTNTTSTSYKSSYSPFSSSNGKPTSSANTSGKHSSAKSTTSHSHNTATNLLVPRNLIIVILLLNSLLVYYNKKY